MNHSNDHAHFSQLTTSQIVENVTECSQKIEAITGTAPILFRCPYGEYDDHVISALNGMGVYTVQWDVDSLDWKGISASEITNRVLSNVSPGSIVLFHNAAENTPEALPGIIQSLLDDGYTIVPVSEMIMRDNYEMDHTGKQCKIGTA
jgi:peptidoglycan/xylan/chitin deacetylase (PgdA/CDA1 family)